MSKRIGNRPWGPIASALLIAVAATAADPPRSLADITVEAHLDRDMAAVNERLTLTVTVMGSGRAGTPELPELPDFAVFPAGSSRNFSFINGQMSSSTVYTYILAPRRQGNFTIPPIAVVDGNNRYISRPLEVRVEAASSSPMTRGPSAPSPPPGSRRGGAADAKGVFVTAEADPKTAYVGEQVTLTVRFYQGVRLLDRPDYRPPAATGFWVEQLPGERTYYTEVNGRKYHVTELRSALFPTDAGEMTIGPAEVDCVIEQDMFDDPFSLFRSGFGGGEKRTVRSQPLTLTVRPLPREGRPADWSGAVGKFRIESSLDLPRVRVGEAATLTVTLTGQGNIRAVGDLKVPEIAGLRAFDSGVTVDDRREGAVAGGVKKLTRVLIAEASGSYTVPAISLSVFRPDLGRYETLRSNPITLEVAEGGGSGGSPAPAAGGTNLLAAANVPNLRFIRTGDPELRRRRSPPWASPGFWLLQLAPFGGLAAVELLTRHRQRVEVDTGYARHRRSAQEARRRLKEARAHLTRGEPRAFYGAVAQALLGYVSDRANLAAASLTPTEARAELERRQIDPALIQSFTACLERCDFGRFAPGADGARREVMAEAETLIRALARAGL